MEYLYLWEYRQNKNDINEELVKEKKINNKKGDDRNNNDKNLKKYFLSVKH